jgi:hypothetical protein
VTTGWDSGASQSCLQPGKAPPTSPPPLRPARHSRGGPGPQLLGAGATPWCRGGEGAAGFRLEVRRTHMWLGRAGDPRTPIGPGCRAQPVAPSRSETSPFFPGEAAAFLSTLGRVRGAAGPPAPPGWCPAR